MITPTKIKQIEHNCMEDGDVDVHEYQHQHQVCIIHAISAYEAYMFIYLYGICHVIWYSTITIRIFGYHF